MPFPMSYSCPQHELIESPTREKFLTVVRDHLLPRVHARRVRDERLAKRPLEYDVEGDLRKLLLWGETAYLPTLSAMVHLYLWSWMRMDDDFRGWMLGPKDS